MSVKIEICANSVESAINAELGGADRVELCENVEEGGITPSAGAIIHARRRLKIKLYVLIRPRAGDFVYSDLEFEIMKKDIDFCKRAGADGVVFGALNTDGTVDKKRSAELVKLASPLGLTFHRAFDVTKNPMDALEEIIACGFDRILTSGQKQYAEEGTELIEKLIHFANGRISIMPGSGLNETNISQIIQKTRAGEYHASLREAVPVLTKFKSESVEFGSIHDFRMVTNVERVRVFKQIADEAYDNLMLQAN